MSIDIFYLKYWCRSPLTLLPKTASSIFLPLSLRRFLCHSFSFILHNNKQAQPENPMEHFHAFRSAINWSEKFIIGLICFQIVMFLLCLFVSRKDRGLAPRVCLLVFIGVVVRSAEWLNAQGVQHWESFATQDYFDKRGIFIGIMLCAPLLLDSLMMLLFFMKEASKLLIQVKRSEIKTKYKQKNNNNKGGGKKNAGRAKTKKQD